MKETNLNWSAKKLAAETSDAYSYGRYNSWIACVELLRRRKYTRNEAEAILRSKWTRWAADASGAKYGHATSMDLARHLDDPKNNCTLAEIRKLALL